MSINPLIRAVYYYYIRTAQSRMFTGDIDAMLMLINFIGSASVDNKKTEDIIIKALEEYGQNSK
jgi:hypothetical protein